jgi:peptidoglycan biosynthesis protein MviN/MurJ (putative lipid II flippase)
LISFTIQGVVMLWMLDRRVKGLGIGESAGVVGKMLLATAVMTAVCWSLRVSPLYPTGTGRRAWLTQLLLIAASGAVVYFAVCYALGLDMVKTLRPRRRGFPVKS